MLDAIKKMVGKQEPQAEMLALQAEFSDYKVTAEGLAALLQEQLNVLQAEKASLEAKLSNFVNALAAEEAQAKASKLLARKEKIKAAVGDLKAEEIFPTLESLSDEAFEKIAGAFALAVDVEASSPAFKEAGVEAEVDAASVLVQESAVMKAIREKYQSK